MSHNQLEDKVAGTALAATLELPTAPSSEHGSVKAWSEPVTMLTCMPAAPDPNPLFLEKRVYQGSSGCVYPLPVIDYVETEPYPHAWQAIHLENESLRLMVLPQIGGRIHVGLDKRTGYDFFYRQNVIKPALVGLAGPWISGGVEFNWPQHHRPATFMPVETVIERAEDGSITVWCSDHDPMLRMKGMHGVCLHPGKAYLELKVRLYNRTQQTQTFLWWANLATRVHEQYQSFFPHDVRFAADHAKRAITEYPLSQGLYYGIDYAERAQNGVPAEEQPACFVPDGSYPANDLGWYANIPVPTSYMIVGSRGDFFGGYDHARNAGTVAYANHHIAPGKKQWTWGNHDFGYAWDRSLTESDGPYVELMSGVYTDNQPDFSFLAPGETKTFSQYWYPISEIGVPDLANLHAALRVERGPSSVHVHLQAIESLSACTLHLHAGSKQVGSWIGDLDQATPLHHTFLVNDPAAPIEITLEQHGTTLLRYAPSEIIPVPEPAVATEPPLPQDVSTIDELFLNGLHLEQYRHPTRAPQAYWLEALQRDPGDSRCNLALGRWHLQRGEFAEAERYLQASIVRLTSRNPNPYDGEPHYNLGLALLYQQRIDDAYSAFYKSTWNAAWRAPAYHRLAEIDCRRHDWTTALDHLNRTLRADTDNLNARNLKVIVLLRLDRTESAASFLAETQALDPLDIFSRWLAAKRPPEEGHQRLDLYFDLARAGLYEDALSVVSAPSSVAISTAPLLLYAQADLLAHLSHQQHSADLYAQAAQADSTYVFPSGLDSMMLLERAIAANPHDARAPYYLGNLLYDLRRHQEAIALWQCAVRLDPAFSIPWRNLGFGYFNIAHDPSRALDAFARARICAPLDARVLYEQDQLFKRTSQRIGERLSNLEAHRFLIDKRDDLSVELASLYNSTGQPQQALAILLSRHFQPWEGGEGLVLAQYIRAHLLLGEQYLQSGNAVQAVESFSAASNPPRNLSEARHLLMNLSKIDLYLGEAFSASGNAKQAAEHWERAARQKGDFQQMQVQSVSENTYWSALALRRLGREEEALTLFKIILDYAHTLAHQTPKIDYFATSLPAMLLFDEDLQERQNINALFLESQAQLGLGNEYAALQLLEKLLAIDRSHTGAIDLLCTLRK